MHHYNGAFFLPVERPAIPVANPTRAQLSETVDQQKTQIESLEAALQKSDKEATELSIRIWLPRQLGPEAFDKTLDGRDRVNFKAACSKKDDRTGKYIGGPLWDFQATDNGYGPLCSEIKELVETGNLYVTVTAFLKPWKSQRTGNYGYDWFIQSVEAVERPAAQAPVTQKTVAPSAEVEEPQVPEQVTEMTHESEPEQEVIPQSEVTEAQEETPLS